MAAYYGFNVGEAFDSRFSKVSFESILFYIVASSMFVLESNNDKHKADVNASLNERGTHGGQWYVELSKAFQYGDEYNTITGKYDVIDESKQIVEYVAADEIGRSVFLKVARLVNGELAALSDEQLAAFSTYIRKAKDFGVDVKIISADGDDAKFEIDIWYDPTVLDDQGMLLDGSGVEPALDTVKSHIKNLPFNGEFQIVRMEDALQATKGVVIPEVKLAETKYANNDWKLIDAKVRPEAGYMVIAPENLTFNYRPYDGN